MKKNKPIVLRSLVLRLHSSPVASYFTDQQESNVDQEQLRFASDALKRKKHSPKWFDGDLPGYKDIQEIIWSIFIQVYN